jgi:hypothetical protein
VRSWIQPTGCICNESKKKKVEEEEGKEKKRKEKGKKRNAVQTCNETLIKKEKKK